MLSALNVIRVANSNVERREGIFPMRATARLLWVLGVAALLPVSGAFAQGDGVSSPPVFKGPFPKTVNMRFLSQIGPENLGALEVPGVWAKGMMNDIGGWTSPAGEEYALATNSGGIAIVRVTDPENPEFLGRVESQIPSTFETSGVILPPSATTPTSRPRSTTPAS